MDAQQGHIFALWYAPLSNELRSIGAELIIKDAIFITRVSAVLRLQVGEQVLLFDRRTHATCSITSISKKQIVLRGEKLLNNPIYTPRITALLPLLKKDDLAQAVTQLVACGISAIQLVMTDGVQRSWGGEHEYERLERLMIASAEQSKYFAVPTLHEPIPFAQAVSQHTHIVYGDHEGKPFKLLLQRLSATITESAVLVGPESDFTFAEKKLLQEQGAVACALTPTVLRSHLAITILAGSLRAWYSGGE